MQESSIKVHGAGTKIDVQPSPDPVKPRLRDVFKREVALNAGRAFAFVTGVAKGAALFTAGAVTFAVGMPVIKPIALNASDLAANTYLFTVAAMSNTPQVANNILEGVGNTAMAVTGVAIGTMIALPQHLFVKRFLSRQPHSQGILRPSWLLGAFAGMTLFFGAEGFTAVKKAEFQQQLIEQFEEMFKPAPAPQTLAPKGPLA